MELVINKEILQLVDNETRSLVIIMRSRQRKWLGNMMRGYSFLRPMIEGRIKRKKTRGSPTISPVGLLAGVLLFYDVFVTSCVW